MPQSLVNKEYNTFVKGLITEASPLTFPENASLAEDNFELNVKGYRSRRKGVDYENGFSFVSTESNSLAIDDQAISSFLWEDVNTKGELTILVVQVGLKLFFFDATKQPITDNQLNEEAPLILEGDSSFVFQAASISGNLVVTTNTDRVYQLVYDEAADKVNYLSHGILVRDIWGVSDKFAPEYRHRTSSAFNDRDNDDERLYNLGNNGWNRLSPSNNEETDTNTYASDFITGYNNKFGIQRYPNLIDKVVAGIDTTDSNEFKASLILNNNSSTTLSPTGSYVIDLFRRGDSRLYSYYRLDILDNYGGIRDWETADSDGNKSLGVFSDASSQVALSTVISPTAQIQLKRDKSEGGVKCVASYAGRVFFSGFSSTIDNGDIKSPVLGTYVAFSQVVDNAEKVGKCYQEGDPTSLNDFDLVESDGGTIKIPGAARILKLVPLGRSLIVVASNGLWEIRGGEGAFSATDIIVEKISDIGAINSRSIVIAEDRIFYWSTGGIYAVEREKTGLTLTYSNITSGTIQTYFNSIGNVQKQTAKGVYSEAAKTITWIFNDEDDYDSNSDRYKYNRQLNLNLILNAFYTYTVPIDSEDFEYPRIADIFISPNFISASYEDLVTVNGEVVQVGGEDVVISRKRLTSALSELSYLAIKPRETGEWLFTTAVINNPDFEDWGRDDSESVDAEGYIETGHELVIEEDTQRKKQLQYITTHMERTEDGFDSELTPTNPSSCIMQAKWDFANSANSGKIGQAQQIYRLRRDYIPSGTGDSFDYGQSLVSVKSRVRGRGTALTLRFSTEPRKDCVLYGWGAIYAANSNV